MSFFSKLSSKLDELNLGGSSDKDKPKEREGYPSQQSYPPPSQQYPPPSQQYPPQSQQYPPQSQYGGSPAPPPSGGGYPGQQPGYYNSPPPAAGGPTYAPPSDKPPIPAGWIPQFDQQYQRWYYVEQATGRSQWEAPGYNAGAQGGERGWGAHDSSSHGAPGYGYPPQGSHGGYGGDQGYGHSSGGHDEYRGDGEKKKKDKDHSGMLLGAAGGLAVGAIGGALIADALDDSDEEKHHAAPAPAPVYAAPAAAPVYDTPPAAPPVYGESAYEPAYNAEGEYVDVSDRESVREAREECTYYSSFAVVFKQAAFDQEALNDSSASSSDVEDAREDYIEEYEEAYED